MPDSPASRVGGVLSADIAVPEHAKELHFYARILTTGEAPLWRDDLMNNRGAPIIGLGEQSPEYGDLPLQWMPHIQVADVAASVERALARGGGEVMHQKDERGQSSWAVLSDPNGAVFGIVPTVEPEAVQAHDEDAEPDSAGRIAWLDLTVADAPSTRDFYRDVVGWTVEDVTMEDGDGEYADYAMCRPDGAPVPGGCHARGVNQGIPPVWMICLPVGDLEESLARVRDGGGEVVEARKGSRGELTYAVVRDPVGAFIALAPG